MRSVRGTAIAGTLAALAVGLSVGFFAGNARQSSANPGAVSRQSSAFVPACPHGFYSTDGNYSPLFCKIDSPTALRFYRPLDPHLFALTASATPIDVEHALQRDIATAHPTQPEACSSLALWKWSHHWQAVTVFLPPVC
jgi:hypothetical protein